MGILPGATLESSRIYMRVRLVALEHVDSDLGLGGGRNDDDVENVRLEPV